MEKTDWECVICGQSHSRRENLARHMRSHLGQRPFRCDYCERTFTRSDTLKKHVELSCGRVRGPSAQRRQGARAIVACQRCAGAKLRCSMGSPCQRCRAKGLECRYRISHVEQQPLSPCNIRGVQEWTDVDHTKSSMESSSIDISAPVCYDSATSLDQVTVATTILTTPGQSQAELKDLSCSLPHVQPTRLDRFELPNDISVDQSDLWDPTIADLFSIIPLPFSGDANLEFSEHDTLISYPNSGSDQLNTPSYSEDSSSYISPEAGPHQQNKVGNSGSLRPLDLVESPSYQPASLVQPTLWKKCRSSSTSKNNAAGISSETDDSQICITFTDDEILEMDNYAHIPPVPRVIMQSLADLLQKHAYGIQMSTTVKMALTAESIHITVFTQLYFEYFHPVMPLLHRATFNVEQTTPLLVLAVATIGSRFSRLTNAAEFASVLGKILVRVISSMIEEDVQSTLRVQFIQALVLSQIHLIYSGRREMILRAQFQRSILSTLCKGLLAGYPRYNSFSPSCFLDSTQCEEHVHKWINRELIKRAIFSCWLVEVQLSLHMGVDVIITWKDLKLSLPCHQSIWELSVQDLSTELQQDLFWTHVELFLDEIFRDLTCIKRAYSSSGEFSRTIILSAIYQCFVTQTSSARVVTKSQRPNNFPKDSRTTSDDTSSRTNLESSPVPSPVTTETFVQDAMNSLTELQCCSHDSSIFNSKLYHYIAIMILVPLHALFELSGYNSSRESHTEAGKAFRNWIQSHRRSADCIIEHATSLFTLLRKHGLDSHYDNHCLQISMLSLWAIMNTQIRSQDTCDLTRQPDYIHLSGIGRICGATGARCILIEALQIFRRLPRWEIGKRFAAITEALLVKGDALDL